MNFSSIVALVHYNGDIITDELMSSVFVSEVNKYFEVNNCMSLSVLKQTILNLFIVSDGKSYTVDLCYRCPVTTNKLKTYGSVAIEDDNDVQCVITYAKQYEILIQFEIMTFICEYNEVASDVIWELLERELDESLNIE